MHSTHCVASEIFWLLTQILHNQRVKTFNLPSLSLSHCTFQLVCLLLDFIYLWVCWVFAAAHSLSLGVVSGGSLSSRGAGASRCRGLLLLWSRGSRDAGSVVLARGLRLVAVRLYGSGLVVVVNRLCCSATCGIFLDQKSNQCPLRCKADS